MVSTTQTKKRIKLFIEDELYCFVKKCGVVGRPMPITNFLKIRALDNSPLYIGYTTGSSEWFPHESSKQYTLGEK